MRRNDRRLRRTGCTSGPNAPSALTRGLSVPKHTLECVLIQFSGEHLKSVISSQGNDDMKISDDYLSSHTVFRTNSTTHRTRAHRSRRSFLPPSLSAALTGASSPSPSAVTKPAPTRANRYFIILISIILQVFYDTHYYCPCYCDQ